MRRFHPKGRRLPALERNVLKYRAFEMMILLFHIEDVKSFVLDSTRRARKDVLREGRKGLYNRVWAILVSVGILSQEESDDLQKLIDYRNQVAHRLHELTFDISREPISDDYLESRGSQYDYNALERIESYRSKIEQGISRRFPLVLNFNRLLFESAEKTYKQELERLDRIIRKQMIKRNKENDLLNSELSSVEVRLLEEIEPYRPENLMANGRLSEKGIACCHFLFERGMSDLAVSHLMRVSHASISARRKRWYAEQKRRSLM